MNIVRICHNPFPGLGGPAKAYRQFYDAIGGRSIAFYSPEDGELGQTVIPIDVPLRTRGRPLNHHYYFCSARSCQKAEELVAQASLVFLHGLFVHPPVWGATACRRRGVPYVMALHGYLDPWAMRHHPGRKKLWMAVFGKRMLNDAAAVICTTRREAEKISPWLPEHQKAVVISWPCEVPPLKAVTARRAELRHTLGYTDDDRVLIYLGRLHSMKRPLETIELLAKAAHPRLKLLVVGPDGDVTRRQLQDHARALGWDGLTVVGSVFGEEKYAYFGAADAYVSLSWRENFNHSLAEAMVCGLPAIISPGNDLGWEIGEEDIVWQLRTDDASEALAALVNFAQTGQPELQERGARARTWAARHLGADLFREKLIALHAGIVERAASFRAPKLPNSEATV